MNENQILTKKEDLLEHYSERNSTFTEMRDWITGDKFWAGKETAGSKITANKLHNLTYSLMSLIGMPEFEAVVKDPVRQKERARKVEATVNGIWEDSQPEYLHDALNWNCIALGHAVIHTVVHTKNKQARFYDIKPETYYPAPTQKKWLDERDYAFIIETIKGEEVKSRLNHHPKVESLDDETEVEYVLFEDKTQVRVFIDDTQALPTWRHDHGFTRFTDFPGLIVPNRNYGISHLSSSTELVDYYSELLSHMADIIKYHANPRVVIEGSMRRPQDFKVAPDDALVLQEGESVRFLEHRGTPPSVEQQQKRVEQLINESAMMPETLTSGQAPGSIVTGRGIQALAGPILSLINKRQKAMGRAFAQANKKALTMLAKYYPDETLVFDGTISGTAFQARVKGRELKGLERTRAVWNEMSNMDWASKFYAIAGMEDRLWISKHTARKMAGVKNPEQEQALIQEEQAQAFQVPQAPGAPEPITGNPNQLNNQIESIAQGKGFHRSQQRQPQQPVQQAPGQPSLQGLDLATVTAALVELNLPASVFIVGEIAQTGQTRGPVDIALNIQDHSKRTSAKQRIVNTIRQLGSTVNFIQVEEEPTDGLRIDANAGARAA